MKKSKRGILVQTNPVKSVGWSYPSSENARSAGFGDRGCYTVSVEDATGEHLPRALAHFMSREAALEFARELPVPWSYSFVHCHPVDAMVALLESRE